MAKLKVITVNQSVFAENDAIAAETREALRKKGLLFLNVMASPGAGKTTLLLATIRALKDECRIGVMEADIEATVDAKKIEAAGARAIQVHTGGACAMDAAMTREAVAAIGTEALDLLILENVGNLVCPAETDTGAAADAAAAYRLGFTQQLLLKHKYISWREHYVSNKKLQVLVLHRITGSLRRRVPRTCGRAFQNHRGKVKRVRRASV